MGCWPEPTIAVEEIIAILWVVISCTSRGTCPSRKSRAFYDAYIAQRLLLVGDLAEPVPASFLPGGLTPAGRDPPWCTRECGWTSSRAGSGPQGVAEPVHRLGRSRCREEKGLQVTNGFLRIVTEMNVLLLSTIDNWVTMLSGRVIRSLEPANVQCWSHAVTSTLIK